MDVVVVESPAKAKTINKYLGSEYTVLAGFSIIKGVRFGPRTGSFLVTASYDHTVRFYSTRDYSFVGPLHSPHEEKVMCVDVSADERHVVTGGYDRTFKIYAQGDGMLAQLQGLQG